MGLWSTQHAQTISRDRFRAHDQYLEQNPSFPYHATVDHIRDRGLYEWLTILGEDGAYGCVTAEVDGLVVSRDLLDSVLEIAFLRDSLGSAWWAQGRFLLDIGAGYGRFVHRMARLYPRAYVYCTDDIPVSQEVCRTYLSARGIGPGWVVPIESLKTLPPLDMAVNIHSWSECTTDEIAKWLGWLEAKNVARIFIVPHHPDLLSWTPNGPGASYRPMLTEMGYALEQYWCGPECNPKHYFLFGRE